MYCEVIVLRTIHLPIHTHTHAHIHTDTHTQTHTHTCTCMHTQIHAHTDTRTHTHTCTHIHTHAHTRTNTHTHVHTYMHTYMHTPTSFSLPVAVVALPEASWAAGGGGMFWFLTNGAMGRLRVEDKSLNIDQLPVNGTYSTIHVLDSGVVSVDL